VAFRVCRRAKAGLLYHAIENSHGFYASSIDAPFRSVMNVTFRLRDEALNERFVDEARQHGLLQIKGHRVAGGMRASLYNAMPLEGVRALVQFMQEFSRQHS